MNNDHDFSQPDNKNIGSKSFATIVIIIAVITFVIFGIAIGMFFAISKTIRNSVKEDKSGYNVSVTAEIIENLESHVEDGTIYTPVYEYEYRGRSYRVTGRVSTSDKKYEVGQKVNIMIKDQLPGKIYDPELNGETLFKNFEKETSMIFLPFIIIPFIMIISVFVIIMVVRSSSGKRIAKNVYTKKQTQEQEEYFDPNDDYRG